MTPVPVYVPVYSISELSRRLHNVLAQRRRALCAVRWSDLFARVLFLDLFIGFSVIEDSSEDTSQNNLV